MIANKRKLVLEDLEDYEQRSKRYWEGRVAGRTSTKRIDPMDEDIEEELNEIMKTDDLPTIADEVEDFTITVFTEEKKSPKSENNGFGSPEKEETIEVKVEEIKEEMEEENDDDEAEVEVPEENADVDNDEETVVEEADESKLDESVAQSQDQDSDQDQMDEPDVE
jgi:hypothetical protein